MAVIAPSAAYGGRDCRTSIAQAGDDCNANDIADECEVPTFSFADALAFAGPGARSIAVADFDEDGLADVALAAAGAGVALLRSLGHGEVGPPVDAGAPQSENVTAADFDGDGHVDLAVSQPNQALVAIFWGAGDGSFPTSTRPPTGAGPNQSAAADFDGDGRRDLGA